MKTHSNQATPKYLGYVYQVLIAIEQCFEAKKNQTIWIECYGDVYNGTIGTEVKHHIGQSYLIDNSPDFWKTLKNLVTEDISGIEEFVLHTTSDIAPGSIFDGWNDLAKGGKYKRLKDHSPVATVADFYAKTITNFPRKDLLPILDKLTIKSSQLPVKEKWEMLKECRILSYIPEELREDAFHWVYSYVNKMAIEDHRHWCVKINDFDSARQFALNKFTQHQIPFPSISKEEVDSAEGRFRFVDEMEDLGFRVSPIEKAVSDYLRSGQSRLKLLSYEPTTMVVILDEYDETVLDCVMSKKDYLAEKLEIDDFGSTASVEASRGLYHESIHGLNLIEVPGVSSTRPYYQNGRIHHSVDKGQFTWKFRREDLV